MASSNTTRQYMNRLAKTHGVLDLDDWILDEVLEATDAVGGDSRLAPWRRGHRVAIRSAFSH